MNLINNFNATLAQLVEHLTCNEDVVGSIPTGGSISKEFLKLRGEKTGPYSIETLQGWKTIFDIELSFDPRGVDSFFAQTGK